jgi:histidine triad (HIT) family protein
LIFHLARSAAFGTFVGWIFAHMSFAIPVKRLLETDTLIAFYHPQPAYAIHILLVPKIAIKDLAALGEQHKEFLNDLFPSVQRIVRELGLEQAGYRLIANGGSYQDIPQLHFHLVSGRSREK